VGSIEEVKKTLYDGERYQRELKFSVYERDLEKN